MHPDWYAENEQLKQEKPMSKATLILETLGEVAHAVSSVVEHIQSEREHVDADKSLKRLTAITEIATDTLEAIGDELEDSIPKKLIVGHLTLMRDIAAGYVDPEVDDNTEEADAAG